MTTAYDELLERSANAPPGSTAYERMVFGSLEADTFDALVDVSNAIPVSTAWIYLKNSKIAAAVTISVTAIVAAVNRLFSIIGRDDLAFTVRQAPRTFAVGAAGTDNTVNQMPRDLAVLGGNGDKTVEQVPRSRTVQQAGRTREEGPDGF